ncbi:DUF1707 domain-containing protein [Microbispora sp. NPDC049125]|uniref:DUF1707 domain-containing protein n=1 Tax=Microbispora sp. NPDC049125 TaxID=3154929 RepID=UPI003466B6BF
MARAVILIIFVLILVIAAFSLIRWARAARVDSERKRWLGMLADDQVRGKALEVLAEAYADGRLSLEEYSRRRDDLMSGRMMPNRQVLALVKDLGVSELS